MSPSVETPAQHQAVPTDGFRSTGRLATSAAPIHSPSRTKLRPWSRFSRPRLSPKKARKGERSERWILTGSRTQTRQLRNLKGSPSSHSTCSRMTNSGTASSQHRALKQKSAVPWSRPTGGSWKKSPHSTSCTPPKGLEFRFSLFPDVKKHGRVLVGCVRDEFKLSGRRRDTRRDILLLSFRLPSNNRR